MEGHLFHLCRDQQVQEDRVEYLDLLLDIWIDSGGHMTILDRDELEACAEKGVIGEGDLAWIALHEQKIKESWRQILFDFDLLL